MLWSYSLLNKRVSRRLVLISLDWTRPKDPPLCLGHAAILANTTKYNIEFIPYSWSVNSTDFAVGAVVDSIMQHANANTDVAFGVFVWNERYLQIILNSLKNQHYPGRVILGGPQISHVKNGLEKFYPQADVFIRGYAEDAMVKLMMTPSLQPKFKGIHYAGQVDEGLSVMVDLEELPSPYLSGLIKAQRFIRL